MIRAARPLRFVRYVRLRGPMSSRAGWRAFTLVEMLLAVVMIGILAGAVVVTLHGRRDTYALESAAKDLAAAIRFAVAEAKFKRSLHRVALSDDLRSYRVEFVPNGKTDFRAAKGMAGAARRLADGVWIASVDVGDRWIDPLRTRLEFGPTGGGFAGAIELQNRGGATIRIEVVAGSGQVHVRE